MSAGPLSHLKVLDLTRVRAGPTCVKQFADWGADVVKIEMPAGLADEGFGARDASDFQNLQRNKRSMTLNLKDPRGVEVFRRLAKTADVVVENYRPDVKFRLGIDYETLAKDNPRLVYASISGFGQDGPYEKRPGFDQIAQGLGGLMWVTGLPGQGPVRAGIPIADLTGGLFAAIGIFIALQEREKSGRGQWVQSSLLGAMVNMMDFQAARWLVEGEVAPQAGNDHPTSIPTGVFPTTDGFVNIAASGKVIYTRLCEALGVPELAAHPDYASSSLRSKNRVALNAALSERTKRWSSADIVELLAKAGVPCGPIYKMDQVFADPQVRHLGMAVQVPKAGGGEIPLVGPAMKLARTPSAMRRAMGPAGEHNVEILRAAGYGDAEIDQLKKDGIV